MSPLGYTEYRKFVRDKIASHQDERGYQGKLAAAARCQKSYFSQVLKGDANLSLDQAMGLVEFWGLNELESEYFIELVTLARSHYPPLVRMVKERLRGMVERHERDSKSTGASEIVVDNDWLYYSQWYWSAIHILVGIPRFQNVSMISRCLNLDEGLVEQALQSLKQQGLVEQSGARWNTKPGHRHLSSSSPLNAMNNANWRERAVLDSQRLRPDSLHYTSVQSHSRKDVEAIRQVFLEAIAKSRAIVRPSANEEMTSLCVDFFRVTN
jgi:uncharacterized protein (TIGR02147 family)